MNGFDLDKAMRKILVEARPETCLSATAALVALGFPARTSFLMVEQAVRNNPALKEQNRGNQTHDPSTHRELPVEEPRPDSLADQPGYPQVRRPRVRRALQGRQAQEGQSVAGQGSSWRTGVRRVQGVRQYLLAHSFNYEVDVTRHHVDTDKWQVPTLKSKKLWIVPERISYKEIEEHVCRGVVILYSAVSQRLRVVGVGGMTVEYYSQFAHEITVDQFVRRRDKR